jgi:K+-transporting ATPase ATPase C chain
MHVLLAHCRTALSVFLLLSVITGLVYPLAVTLAAQSMFASQTRGSLINERVDDEGKGNVSGETVIGSSLIGQPFASPGHFWSRPSATAPMPYNGRASGGSNLGANNPQLLDAVRARIAALRAADPDNRAPVPVDLVTASASGLDPDISLAAAFYQSARVARARGIDITAVQTLIEQLAQRPWLGIVGEPRVNVVALNRALDSER